jgi:hypothetical protein
MSSSSFDPGANIESESRERPLSELLSTMTSDLTTLFRQEVELAKAEVREEASKAGQAVAMLAAAGVAALVAVLMLAHAAAWGLSEVIPEGFAYLVVAVLIGIVAAVLLSTGRKRLQTINPTPERTIETLKEDAQTIRERRP